MFRSRLLFIMVTTFMIICLLSHRAYTETWKSIINLDSWDRGEQIQQTSDGGYFIVGAINSLKTDSNGNLLWFTPEITGFYAESGQQTNDGGYILAGSTYQSSDSNATLVKFNAYGSQIWRKTFGGIDYDAWYSSQQTSDGGYILAGETWSFSSGKGDVYLVKTDTIGNELWSRNFGGTANEEAKSVQQTSDGGYIIAGDSPLSLIKTNSNGISYWSHPFGDMESVQQTSDGGYIAIGGSLIKTDANGNLLWSKPINGRSVRQTSDGGYVIARGDSVIVVKLDANGSEIWTKDFGGKWGRWAQETSDGGYIILGSIGELQEDFYIIYYKPGPPGKATNQIPSNGTTNISIEPNLSWSEVEEATSYEVFFGTDPTPDSGEYVGNQTSTTYKPGMLDYETTYYWRVDAKNEFGTTTGDVWFFTTRSIQTMPWIPLLLLSEKSIYDDFSTEHLDGKKWFQRTYVREIVDGKFLSKFGNRSPGMDAEYVPGHFLNSLRVNPNFINPQTINSMQCDITIVESKLDSAPNSESYARIGGIFYSTDPTGGGTTGGGKGDVWAAIGIGDRGNGGLEIFGTIAEFLDDNYQSWNITDLITIVGPINNVTYPITYKLKLIYNGNNRFEFWANNSSDFSTGPTYQDLPYAKTKKLETVINATDGSNNGYISAKFDDFYINNQSIVYDDFSSPLIDLTKWNESEFVREPSNGYLRANIIGYDSMQQAVTYLTEKDAPYLEAKVRIDSSSQLSSGAWGLTRIEGYFYNEIRGPGSGQSHNGSEGNVFAVVRLRYNSDGTLIAQAYVERYNDANESDYTTRFSHDFSVPIALDTYYILSIRFEGKKFTFSCADESVEYNITTPTYPPWEEFRAIRSRVKLDSGETGYVKGRFDDIYIEKK